jgi:ubiquinone/menaquinone biosynthesis C-methylase UbiE
MNPNVARAYDAIAAEYDLQVQGDLWMRHQLWRHYLDCFQPGMHVLDVACGTGIDAIFLAEQGIQVTGIDISPAMISQLQSKAGTRDMGGKLKTYVLEVSELQSWPPQCFDGILSAFAGLNTVPDLDQFAANAADLLRPGGRMLLHMLNRFSLWEWLGLVTRSQWSAAHCLGQQHERIFSIGGEPVKHTLYLPVEAYQFFATRFTLRRSYSLGVLRPPHTLHRIQPLLRAVPGKLDQTLGAYPPFLNWGRFFVLDLEKRGV